MNPNRYKNLIFKKNQEDFALSYALIPNDQLAQQLILDSLDRVISDNLGRELFLQDDYEKNWDDFRWLFLKNLITLGKAKQEVVEGIFKDSPEVPVFYQLDPQIRLVLYLRLNLNFSFAEVAELTSTSTSNTMAEFEAGKRKIVAMMGSPENFVPGWKGKCLLGRKALAFVNGLGGESATDFFESHLRKCNSCQDLILRNEKEVKLLLEIIPREKCDPECLSEFKKNVDEMIWNSTKRDVGKGGSFSISSMVKNAKEIFFN